MNGTRYTQRYLMRSHHFRWCVLPLLLPTLSCSPPAGESSVLDREAVELDRTRVQSVLGGQESELREVIYIQMREGDGSEHGCSATLVAPNLVLTARHCVSGFHEGEFTCTIQGDIDDSFPRVPEQAGEIGLLVPPENVTVHTGIQPDRSKPDAVGVELLSPETDVACRNDIAFLVLDRQLDIPYATLRYGSGMVPGETVHVAGYGLNDAMLVRRTELSGLDLLGVGPSQFYEVEGQSFPRTFVVGRGPCLGDSGGPAFSEATGELVGVLSLLRPGGDCSSSEARSYYTQVAAFDSLIESAFEAAGQAELLEGEGTLGAGGGENSGGTSEGTDAPGCSSVPVSTRGGPPLWLLGLLTLGMGRWTRLQSLRTMWRKPAVRKRR